MHMNSQKKKIAVDKSYSQGTNHARLASLQQEYDLFFPSAFYFELFNDPPEKRFMAINGVHTFFRPHLPDFLRYEIKFGRPALIESHKALTFSDAMKNGEWQLNRDESQILEKYRSETVQPMRNFFNTLIEVPLLGFSVKETKKLTDTDEAFCSLCQRLQEPRRIRKVAKLLAIPHASKLDTHWLQFRRLQVWLLQVFILKRCHPNLKGQPTGKKLEHELHDLEYIILGLHLDALATKETSKVHPFSSMSWKFRILSPDSLLVTS